MTNLGRSFPKWQQVAGKLIGWTFMKSVEAGAATTCYVATAPALARVSGYYFADCNPEVPGGQMLNDALAAKLWQVSDRTHPAVPAAVNRRDLLLGGTALAAGSVLTGSLAGCGRAEILRPEGVPLSPFDADSTAEEVTAGMDLSGRTALVTGANSGLGLRKHARAGAARCPRDRHRPDPGKGHRGLRVGAGTNDAGRAGTHRFRFRRRLRQPGGGPRRLRSTS